MSFPTANHTNPLGNIPRNQGLSVRRRHRRVLRRFQQADSPWSAREI